MFLQEDANYLNVNLFINSRYRLSYYLSGTVRTQASVTYDSSTYHGNNQQDQKNIYIKTPEDYVFLSAGVHIVYHDALLLEREKPPFVCRSQGEHMEKEERYQELFSELSNYERQGVRMQIDGSPASPMQIVSAHMLREDTTYMRDYIMDENGVVKELDFHKIK